MNADQRPAGRFDHEKLDVYQVELRFMEWVTPSLEETQRAATGKTREVCDQLERASLSVLLNTAEGNGRRQRRTRAKFFDDARGSATQCAACLDALVAKTAVGPERIWEGKGLLLRIVSMLCGLVDRFEVDGRLQEAPMEYHVRTVLPNSAHSVRRKRSRTRTRTSGSTKATI